jgi:hypothetical protein
MSDPLTNGLRQFKWPPVLPGEKETHHWSFLAPSGSEILPYPHAVGEVGRGGRFEQFRESLADAAFEAE